MDGLETVLDRADSALRNLCRNGRVTDEDVAVVQGMVDTAYNMAPNNAKANHLKGAATAAFDDPRKAIQYLDAAVTIDPTNKEYRADLAMALNRSGVRGGLGILKSYQPTPHPHANGN